MGLTIMLCNVCAPEDQIKFVKDMHSDVFLISAIFYQFNSKIFDNFRVLHSLCL